MYGLQPIVYTNGLLIGAISVSWSDLLSEHVKPFIYYPRLGKPGRTSSFSRSLLHRSPLLQPSLLNYSLHLEGIHNFPFQQLSTGASCRAIVSICMFPTRDVWPHLFSQLQYLYVEIRDSTLKREPESDEIKAASTFLPYSCLTTHNQFRMGCKKRRILRMSALIIWCRKEGFKPVLYVGLHIIRIPLSFK